MDIQEYVSETLDQVWKALSNLQKKDDIGEWIGRVPSFHYKLDMLGLDNDQNAVFLVHFDLATVAYKNDEAGGKASIKVLEIGGKLSAASEQHSRVSFVVPLGIPRPSTQERSPESSTKPLRL
jgi:hypothetical protein